MEKFIVSPAELKELEKATERGEIPTCECIAALLKKHIDKIELVNSACEISNGERVDVLAETLINLMFIAQMDNWGIKRDSMSIYYKFITYCLDLLGLEVKYGIITQKLQKEM